MRVRIRVSRIPDTGKESEHDVSAVLVEASNKQIAYFSTGYLVKDEEVEFTFRLYPHGHIDLKVAGK